VASHAGRRVVVVGGGLAGLVAAHALRRRGVAVTVLEADDAPGGKMRTIREGGYLLEWGPQAFLYDPDSAFVRAVEWAGLTDALTLALPGAKKRFLLRKGKLRALPKQLPRVLSLPGLLRTLCEPFVSRRALEEEPESVADFARRRFGAQAAELLFGSFVSGVFAGDPARLELASAFPRVHALEQEFGSVVRAGLRGGVKARGQASFAGGMGALPEGLASELGDDLRLSSLVTALERTAGGWTVRAGDAAFEASDVLLSSPAHVSASLLRAHDGQLAELLDAIPYAGLVVVALGYDASAFESTPEGFGFLVPRSEGPRILGCLFPSATFAGAAPAGKVQLRVMIGGRLDPAAIDLSDDELIGFARGEVEPVLRARGEPELTRVFRHARAIPQYEVGHAARLKAIAARLATLPGLHLTGNPYRGISVVDVAGDAAAVAEAIAARGE